MIRRTEHTWSLAVVTSLAILAPCLGGEWCENFESGAGTFWTQPSSSNQWQYTTFEDACKSTPCQMPEPTTGEDGMMVLRPSREGDAAYSRLVSPEMVFSDGAGIEITYWLWYINDYSDANFLLYRMVDGAEDTTPFLNITHFTTENSYHWETMEAGLNLDKGNKIQVVIYGYVAGNPGAKIALDRVILRKVNAENICENMHPVFPTENPGHVLDFFCPSEYGIYMDPQDCHYFYKCDMWRAIRMDCPDDLVFNPDLDVCDFLFNVPSCQIE